MLSNLQDQSFSLEVKTSRTRSKEKGLLGTPLFSLGLIFVVMVGCLSIDVSHVAVVKQELHNATDAAAMAGVQDYTNSATWNSANTDALQVASLNTADGKSVSNSSTGITVVSNSQAPVLASITPASCQVTASAVVDSIIAKMFGSNSNNVSVSSTADYWSTVNSIGPNQMFPIGVSLDDASQGVPINLHNVGDPITFVIQPSGGNACWTSGTTTHPSTPVIEAAVDVALGLTQPTNGANPAMTADGTSQIALTQGLHNGVDLSASPYPALMEQKQFLVFPVISGGKPYNQSRILQGFVCVKVASVTSGAGNLTVTGTLVKGLVSGTGGLLPPGGLADPLNNLYNLSPGAARMVR